MVKFANLKYIVVAIGVAVLLSSLAVRLNRVMDNAVYPVMNQNGRVILIDPGHGGKDPGAVSKNGTKESLLNMQVSLYLAEYLMSYGYEVMLTRGQSPDMLGADEWISSENRKRIISQAQCHMVVSIHMNKFHDESVHGAEVIYTPSSDEGKRLAELVQSSIRMYADKENTRSTKANDSLFAINSNKAPSVLVECGYISNPVEEAKLANADYQKRMAYAICCGIMKYFTNS